MSDLGMVYINATISIKGSVEMTLYNDMNLSEVIHDMIHCGDYEYEVIRGDMDIQELE